MCEALKELWAEDIEKTREEGKKEGIRCMIEAGKELGASKEKMFELVKEKFVLENIEAEEYMKLYW